ncbi:hypothetical protein [Mucilaginibacter sp.]|jgi:hypothetical protein|uniref:hypothetical protein n=1 Tax=Mucilaginibacter sp. TaxID=1882438 RepID=UPI002C90F74A|nr:hypothetical protein [Mucilaginibacter sp.]HTI60760.1 hypothetical protein [Mucilaginibacter sp.]
MDKEKTALVYNRSITLRGLVLDSTVQVERKIDIFLSDYFCDDKLKWAELNEMLWFTERITIGNKKDIFFLILDRHFKDYKSRNPKLVETLENIIPHRNIFAHLEIDLSEETVHKTGIEISFKKYKAGKINIQRYSMAEIQKLFDDFNFVNNCLDELLKTSKAP